MPVKRIKKQSKKRGGGMFDYFLTNKTEVSQPAADVVPAVVPGSKPATEPASAPATAPATASAPATAPASAPATAPASAPATAPASAPASAPAVETETANEGKEVPAVVSESSEVNNPKTDEVGKSEVEQGTVLEEPKTNSSWWPFSGGKSRRKRSKKGAKGSAKKRSSKKRSSKGSAKRCSKKNCKSRKHKH